MVKTIYFISLGEMIIIAPTDAAFGRFVPELKAEVPNPLFKDYALMKYILANHIIIREGSIPQRILDSLPEYYEFIKINLAGRTSVFHIELDKDGNSMLKEFFH